MTGALRFTAWICVAFLLSWGCATAPKESPAKRKITESSIATTVEAVTPHPVPGEDASAIRDRLRVTEPTVARARELTDILPGHPYPWILLGLASLAEDDLTTSTSAFNRALELNADHPTALLGLGDVAGRKGNLVGMEDYYEKAWKSSGDIEAANRLAYIKIKNRQPDIARSILQEAVKNHPEDVTIRNNLAAVLDMSGKTSEALDLLENTTADNPGIFKTRAMIQLKEGHLDLAGKDIESAFAKGPAGPESLHLLGILNLQRGKLSAAEESFRNIIGKYPGYSEGYLNLGLTLRRQGRFKEAAVVYSEGIAATGDPDLYLNIGVLYELYLGKPERALDNYRKFIELEGAESLRINGWIGYLSGLQSVLKKKEVLSP